MNISRSIFKFAPWALMATMAILPGYADACGGFFCSRKPVDQQAERIIFVQEDANTISSYVEILYAGAAEDFAWVVPVPSVAELEVWNGRAINALDLATEPQFNYQNDCLLEAAADGGGGGGSPPNRNGGVEVLAEERVGPFDTATIRSEDPRALAEWLRVNGYRIVPAMDPFIALYTAENMAFLAMKLAPGEDTDSIQPIKMTYRATAPAIPLRLTSIAAQLEMGVKIWVLGDTRYGPDNVPDIFIDDAQLKMDPYRWISNYQPLVARKIDAAGGHGFITEYAHETEEITQRIRDGFIPNRFREEAEEARDLLVTLLESKPYITRLYTRVSPEEMDVDPIFVPVSTGDVSNIHTVPEQEGLDECARGGGGEVDAALACEFIACGAGGVCAGVAGEESNRMQVGCICAAGAVARAGTGPDGNPIVACGDGRLNFTQPTDDPAIQFPDPCTLADFCGENGECLSLNGSISCRCEVGYLAIPVTDEQGMLVPNCVAALPETIPEQLAELREPNLPYPGRTTPMNAPGEPGPMGTMIVPKSDGGCRAVPGRGESPFWFLLAPGLLLLRRRRR